MTDFTSMRKAAIDLGASAEGVMTDLASLRASKKQAILELNERHFIALVGFDDDLPLISDPSSLGDTGVSTWSPARLEGLWTGRALLVWKERKTDS